MTVFIRVSIPAGMAVLLVACGGGGNKDAELSLISPLNDTGATYCVDTVGARSECAEAPLQDGNSGRDHAAVRGELEKEGSGAGGLDFTKLDAEGHALADQTRAWADDGSEGEYTQWSCVRDNHTGLTWEMKSPFPQSLRHPEYLYQWHSADDSTNGGDPGLPGSEECGPVPCNTQAYTNAVNQQQLCGYDDWRLPTVAQLLSLVVTDHQSLAIDADFFPHTQPSHYWTRQSYAPQNTHAWYVYFSDGSPSSTLKSKPMYVRLVRVPQRPELEVKQ